MRKKEQEITDRAEIESVLHRADVCRIAFCTDGLPYIVPVNFGYKDGCIYIHSSPEGQKVEMLKRNNRVCFEVEADVEIAQSGIPCKWGISYRSVIGFGRASLVQDYDQKVAALDVIMDHYSTGPYEYDVKMVHAAAIIKVEIESMTGKRSGQQEESRPR